MASVFRLCTYIMAMFLLIRFQFPCEGMTIISHSSKKALNESKPSHQVFPGQRSRSTTSEAEYTNLVQVNKYRPTKMTSSRVIDYILTYREPSNSKDIGGQMLAVSLLNDVPNIGPCSVRYCSKDTIVNCSGLSLTEVSSTWFPRNTTAIFLDNNDVKLINSSSFSHLSDLRVLSLSNNNIKQIQPNAFRDLASLKTLKLEHNSLTEVDFPYGLFDPLVQLTDLDLRHNDFSGNLPEYLLRELKNLQLLTLDAAGDTFHIEDELPNLRSLVLSGNVKFIDGKSFENVPNLTHFSAYDLRSLSNFTDTALQPLRNLDVFFLSDTSIGVSRSLQILKPLVGKNMTSIYLRSVSLSDDEVFTVLKHNEGILSLEKTQYLIQICVKHFSLIGSHIFVVNENTFSSPLWKQCLISLDLSDNPLKGTRFAFSIIMNFKHIEMLNLENAFRVCYEKNSFSKEEQTKATIGISAGITESETCGLDLMSENSQAFNYDTIPNYIHMNDTLHQSQQILSEITVVDGINVHSQSLTEDNRKLSRCSFNDKRLTEGQNHGYFTVYFSGSIRKLKLKRLLSGAGLTANIIFVGLDNLVFLDLRDSGIRHFTSGLFGFDFLQVLMLSGNDISVLAGHFFDGACNLVELDLSNCRLNPVFMASQSKRVLQNLLQLKRLDLSSNMLYFLQLSTFATNKLLEKLDLSKNRFKNIPFNLKDTPNLKMLDLRENSLPLLEPTEREELDKLANRHGEFHLLISGNVLSCGCESLRFLNWLATTRVRLDGDGHFTCMNNEGHLSYWSVTDDLEALWRKCSGETFLALAVILLFIMAIGFLSVFLTWKNKTFLMRKFQEIVFGSKQKVSSDYPTGVFIGYARSDYTFPCFILSSFIEEELHMTTHVYDRDVPPSCGMASSIVDAINNSWRTILVFNENFLFHDEWAMFTMRSAVYAISTVNPARLVVLVHRHLRHRLPAEVVNAVPEENILVISQWRIDYSLREKLRTRL